ncbi:MAG: hypothetical protein ACXAB7_09990 [Candidatus Kariarchaeaceae archaeon]|jgi:hypothetical protein
MGYTSKYAHDHLLQSGGTSKKREAVPKKRGSSSTVPAKRKNTGAVKSKSTYNPKTGETTTRTAKGKTVRTSASQMKENIAANKAKKTYKKGYSKGKKSAEQAKPVVRKSQGSSSNMDAFMNRTKHQQ